MFARGNKSTLKPEFETIDGQQRHTTLSIMLAVFKHVLKCQFSNVEVINLNFDSRERSHSTLHDLYQEGTKGYQFKKQEPSMLEAYSIIEKYLTTLFKKEADIPSAELQNFWNYFTTKVIILRSPVPHDTDLNHYFEIMNNRGEQLEKYEVLKARLMKQVPFEQQYAFVKIWDACTDMDSYVQYGFHSEIRKKLFSKDLNEFTQQSFELAARLFEQPAKENENTSQKRAKFCLETLFKDAKIEEAQSSTKNEKGDLSSITTRSIPLMGIQN